MAETVVTTISITAESWSTRTAKSALKSPTANQLKRTMSFGEPPKLVAKKVIQASTIETSIRPEVMYIAGLSPIWRLPRPAMSAPISGRMTIQTSIARPASAVHHVDVFNRDRTTVAEIDHQDGQTDRGLGRGDGQ